MAIDNKTDLIKEIEVFSKALCDCRGIIGADYSDVGNVIIPISKFAPYYSEQGILKRNDYSEEILDEEAFLVFYGLFFDMIELNPNAEKVSDSQYFNTLYQSYKDKQKRKIADLDLFMQLVETKKEKEAISRNNNKFDMIEVFLHHVLIDIIKAQYTLRTHHITKIEEEFFSKIHEISSQELLKYIKLCKYEKYFNDYFKGDVLYEELKRRYNISTTNSENEIVNG